MLNVVDVGDVLIVLLLYIGALHMCVDLCACLYMHACIHIVRGMLDSFV